MNSISRITPRDGGGPLVARVLGRCPEIEAAVLELDRAIRLRGRIERDLKESVRRTTAEIVGCRYCASLGGIPRRAPNRRHELAIELAQQMAIDPSAVEDRDFNRLREVFDEQEIVELVAWIAYLVVGGQSFGAVMALEPASAQEADWYQSKVVEG